jgi:DTW domain-containing protein
MRSMTAPGAPGRCPRCLLLVDFCVCELLGAGRESRPRILVVRHQWEAFKSTGTARLASLALSNLRIVDMAAENPEPVRTELGALENAWLLYPSGGDNPRADITPPQTLVVLDGTWRQTRKMLRRLPELGRLPHFSLPTDGASSDARDRLREAPRPGARSTLESIADALCALDSPETGQHLLDLHQRFVERTRWARGQRDASQTTPA